MIGWFAALAREIATMLLSSAPRLLVFSAFVLSAFGSSARAAEGAAEPPRVLAAHAPAKKPAQRPAAAKPKAAKLSTKKLQAKKPPKKPKTTTVVLYQLNRHDTFTIRQRDLQGRPPKGFQKRFDRFLRCHYTNTQHAMNPRIERLLYQTGRHWPGQRIEVVSGYRSPSVAKNPHSPHMQGLACDFRVAGVRNTELRDYLRRSMKKVGVGYYPNSSFVHLDVRKDRSAFWIDYSGPGERAMYSQTPSEDLKTGRAEAYHPTKIGDDWINDAPPDKSVPADDEADAKGTAASGAALAGQPPRPTQSATP
jgi:uncharacterized protein YcbK (DUF882 family)